MCQQLMCHHSQNSGGIQIEMYSTWNVWLLSESNIESNLNKFSKDSIIVRIEKCLISMLDLFYVLRFFSPNWPTGPIRSSSWDVRGCIYIYMSPRACFLEWEPICRKSVIKSEHEVVFRIYAPLTDSSSSSADKYYKRKSIYCLNFYSPKFSLKYLVESTVVK